MSHFEDEYTSERATRDDAADGQPQPQPQGPPELLLQPPRVTYADEFFNTSPRSSDARAPGWHSAPLPQDHEQDGWHSEPLPQEVRDDEDSLVRSFRESFIAPAAAASDTDARQDAPASAPPESVLSLRNEFPHGYNSDSQLLDALNAMKASNPGGRPGARTEFRTADRTQDAIRRRTRSVVQHAVARGGVVAPGQPGTVRRSRGKAIEKQLGTQESALEGQVLGDCTVAVSSYCIAFELDLLKLAGTLADRFGGGNVQAYPQERKAGQPPEILHAVYIDDNGAACGDVLYFEFGNIVTWNLSSGQSMEAVWQLAGQHAPQRIPEADIEVDEVVVQYGTTATFTIQDDKLTVPARLFGDMFVKVAISLAFAQSTRISVQETQIMAMVYDTRDLPFQLVKSGTVNLEHSEIARLIGSVFLQKTALNMQVLSGHKETPKFFWGMPDYLQDMYHAVSDYLDLDERAVILNTRFSALTDMLDVLRDEQNKAHEEHLEWIVIFLIFITICLGILQMTSLVIAHLFQHSNDPDF